MQRRKDLQRPPRTAKEAALRPFRDIGNGLYCGVAGLVKVPYASVRRYGISALPSGVVKGVAGLAAKPVVGALDAVTHIGDALRQVAKNVIRESAEPAYRLRLSNLFGPDGRLLPYSSLRALGTYILRALDQAQRERIGVGTAINESVGLLTSLGKIGRLRQIGSSSAVLLSNQRGKKLKQQQQQQQQRSSGFDSVNSEDNDDRGTPGNRPLSLRLAHMASRLGRDRDAGERDSLTRSKTLSRTRGFTVNRQNTSTSRNFMSVSPRPSFGLQYKFDFTGLDWWEDHPDEHVVHTAIIRKGPGVDLVVVASTSRVVVTYLIRKHGG